MSSCAETETEENKCPNDNRSPHFTVDSKTSSALWTIREGLAALCKMTLNEGLGHSFGTKLLCLQVTTGVPSLIRFTDILVQANFFIYRETWRCG